MSQRFYRSPEYWKKRAAGAPPLGSRQEGVMPDMIIPGDEPSSKRVRIDDQPQEQEYEPSEPYEPSVAPDPPDDDMSEQIEDPQPVPVETTESQMPEPPVAMESTETNAVPEDAPPHIQSDDEGLIAESNPIKSAEVMEISIDITPEDITDNPLCLWSVLDECLQVATTKAAKRRVEVSLRKLSNEDRALFEKAMQKEWQSWVENRVMSLCKKRGVDPEKVIRARWVLVWKKSSDPDIKTKTPKARLVLVGWQDPMLGKTATDSPTLRKETKSVVLCVFRQEMETMGC